MTEKYSAVDTATDDELAQMLLPETESVRRFGPQWKSWMSLLSFVNGVIFCVATAAVILSVRSRPHLTAAHCLSRLSTFSPGLEVVEYSTVKFNGTFRHPSIYRGTPTPELDAAWDRLTMDVQPLRLSRETLERIGKVDRPSLVRYREEDGGGYMASVEVVHQLHCLNMLRKYTYNDYYKDFDKSFTIKEDIFRTHLDHCVELIRQNLMCIADTGVITYEWVDGWDLPYPDFNTAHQCRNYDKVLEWAYSQSVHVPRPNVTREAVDYEVDLIVPP
ncbi:hypothetical protein DFH09DRAFT_972116 [Mycena vulgaris]|nr:hypothetical protein DFH09DRAFT_972116 [Mycena vulgaris]